MQPLTSLPVPAFPLRSTSSNMALMNQNKKRSLTEDKENMNPMQLEEARDKKKVKVSKSLAVGQDSGAFARSILTPPPSSDMDIQPDQTPISFEPVARCLLTQQPHALPGFEVAANSSSPPRSSSSYRPPTTPIKNSGRHSKVESAPVDTLSLDFDGSFDLILGRSKKGSTKSHVGQQQQGVTPGCQKATLLAASQSLPQTLLASTSEAIHDNASCKPAKMAPLPRRAQHTSRNHILVRQVPTGGDSCLVLHVLGQNGCRVRVLRTRCLTSSFNELDYQSGVGKRYVAGRTVTIRPPPKEGQEDESEVVVVDVEVDMYSCKTIIHWSTPLSKVATSETTTAPSSPSVMSRTRSTPSLQDLPPSSPPLFDGALGLSASMQDDDETEEESPEVLLRPAPKSTTSIHMPKPSRPTAFLHQDSFFGFGPTLTAGSSSRNPHVIVRKVVTPQPIPAARPASSINSVATLAPTSRKADVPEQAELSKVAVAKEPLKESTKPQASKTLHKEPITPRQVTPAAPVPSATHQPEPASLKNTSAGWVGLVKEAPKAVHVASSPLSIYSQMTSDSEEEAVVNESHVILERLGSKKGKSTKSTSGKSKKSGKAVKQELIDAAELKQANEQRGEGVKAKSPEMETLPSASKLDSTPSEVATCSTEPSLNKTHQEPIALETPPVPDSLDIQALVATSIAFSGVSAISAADLVKTILDSQPSMRKLGSDLNWASWVGDCLRGHNMFGRIDRKGKDSSGHPLLPLYHYIPSNDPESDRALELGSCMRPLRGVQRGGGKAIDWRPVGSRGRR